MTASNGTWPALGTAQAFRGSFLLVQGLVPILKCIRAAHCARCVQPRGIERHARGSLTFRYDVHRRISINSAGNGCRAKCGRCQEVSATCHSGSSYSAGGLRTGLRASAARLFPGLRCQGAATEGALGLSTARSHVVAPMRHPQRDVRDPGVSKPALLHTPILATATRSESWPVRGAEPACKSAFG